MEEDRAIADLGPDVSAELNGDDETVKRTPKRRFIGRRAADAQAAARAATGSNSNSNGTIEDSGAVQGASQLHVSVMRQHTDTPPKWHRADETLAP